MTDHKNAKPLRTISIFSLRSQQNYILLYRRSADNWGSSDLFNTFFQAFTILLTRNIRVPVKTFQKEPILAMQNMQRLMRLVLVYTEMSISVPL